MDYTVDDVLLVGRGKLLRTLKGHAGEVNSLILLGGLGSDAQDPAVLPQSTNQLECVLNKVAPYD